ncbi:hypothetical protein, partial [Klebsiella pneumoniae]|uniref:hypothetical protein n=1 Tax=Klebsiella pneumoniae TaxID=573 RepID=UPI0027315414
GNFDKAELFAKIAYNKASKSALFALNLSEILRQTGNITQSKQAFENTIKLSPSWETFDLQKIYGYPSLYDMDWYLFYPKYEYP